ncbi:MAG TPA: hypothetical protein VNV82_10345 [Bryobacteraceae bacterium]|nr:hypothetical protein [Bryobacteraceae bacterium]
MNGLGGATNPNLGTSTQLAPDGLTPFVPSDANMSRWAQEISLDVMWANAIAPGANITLVLAKSNADADILSATKHVIDNNFGDVISQSFGEDESCMDPNLLAEQHQLFAEATMKNVTIFASSGDSGAAQGTCDGKSLAQAVSSPAVDPLVTGVRYGAAGGSLLPDGLGMQSSREPGSWNLPGRDGMERAWNWRDRRRF